MRRLGSHRASRSADNRSVDISVIIPTRGRAPKLSQCVQALFRQQLPTSRSLSGRFEVLVSIDGEDDQASEAAALGAWSADSHNPLRVITGPREGINAARNRALGEASGRWTLCINDDLYAQPDLLAQHILGHLEALDREGADARDGVIVGDAPWSVHPDDSLFDRLARETSIIFFYHRMNEPAQSRDRWKDWGFRHYYTLNASAPTRELCEIGGFAIFPVVYGYDDLEAAWRLKERFGTPIYYRPGAKGTHDHRYTPDEYLRREHTLGRAAWCLALASPGCAYDMFGRDITTPGELDYSREFVERERTTAARLRESFLEMGRIPSSAISGPASSKLIGLLYEQHLLLKRWEWRRGLMEESEKMRSTAGRVLRSATAPAIGDSLLRTLGS